MQGDQQLRRWRRSAKERDDGSTGEVNGSLDTALSVLSGDVPGFRFVRGVDVPSACERFRTLPPSGRLRLLAPAGGRAFGASLHCFAVSDKWRNAAATVADASNGGRVLSGHLSLVGPAPGGVTPLRGFLAEIIGTSDFELAIRLTSGRPNAKLVIAAIAPDGTAICFAKFGPPPLVSELVRAEAETLAALADASIPAIIPTVLFHGSWSGCSVLVTTWLPMRPLPRKSTLPHLVSERIFASQPSRREVLVESSYWTSMTDRIGILARDGLDGGGMLQRSLELVEQRWGQQEFDFGRAHGDWARSNLGAHGEELVALDWERSRGDLPRNVDMAHFALVEAGRSVRSRLIDPYAVGRQTSQYLEAAGRPSSAASALVAMDLLEMVARFAEARSAGLAARDTKFGPMLAALRLERGEPMGSQS